MNVSQSIGWRDLIRIPGASQVNASTPDITQFQNRVFREFLLDRDVPLPCVRNGRSKIDSRVRRSVRSRTIQASGQRVGWVVIQRTAAIDVRAEWRVPGNGQVR